MTIVSHTHRFIFIKPRKVASTSLLMALGAQCRPPDIVTAPTRTEGLIDTAMNDTGFRTHMHPLEIRSLIAPEVYDSYLKVTCVRNPWDLVVSMLLWRFRLHQDEGARISEPLREALFAGKVDTTDPEYQRHVQHCISRLRQNMGYWFAPDGTPIADVYLRFETLQADFDAFCDRLSLKRATLPHMKSGSRPADGHYRSFFDAALAEAVATAAEPAIRAFGYAY